MVDEKRDQVTAPGPKVGVYVCHCGGNISDHVDVEKVCEDAKGIPGVVTVKNNMFMCSDPGQELIMEDLKNGTIDRVVVASCAPSLHESTFRSAISRAGGNPYTYEHANIREQVSWVHHGEGATEKATRLVAAAVGKARELHPLEPFRVDAKRHATVIGGGVAGLRAAKDLADRGIQVVLIEKSPFLGGWTAHWDRLSPTEDDVSELIPELCRQVLDDPAVEVHTCSHVISFEGFIGNFRLGFRKEPPAEGAYAEEIERMKQSGADTGDFIPHVGVCPEPLPEASEEQTVETGVVVLATGFRPYTPRKGEYGYGEIKEVITLPDLIRIIAENRRAGGGQLLQVNGRKIRAMAMIHCVGSRQIPGIHEETEGRPLNQYCSRVCCGATLHAANLIRETHPGTRIFDFYRDIRTYGRGQEEVYEKASDNKVLFFRFEAQDPPEVSGNAGEGDFPVSVKVKDTLTFGEEIETKVDLVVLAVGMEPNDVSDLVEMMKLPVGADRFLLEVHPKLRPVELSVSGVLVAGTSQAPFDVGETCAAASAAAVKASAVLARGGFVELDPFIAEIDMGKCKGTGACVEACIVDGALRMVEMDLDGEKVLRPEVVPALCQGCGACTAVCPENAINVSGWTLKQYEKMVEMIVSEKLAA